MLSYYLKFRKKYEIRNPKTAKTSKEKLMLLLKCVVCDRKKLRFTKEQEANGLLPTLGWKTSLCKFPLLGDILF